VVKGNRCLAQNFADVSRIPSEWHFTSRADLEAVVRIEFPPDLAEQLLAEHQGYR
jgi:hypothetical protein